jgi:hypothetical protein
MVSRQGMSIHAAFIAFVGLALLGSSLTADVVLSRAEADSLTRKMREITDHNITGKGKARITSISEREVNAYLRYVAPQQMPPGLVDPTVTIVGEGRLAATAIVDLDSVKRQRPPTGWLDPMNLLSGRVPVKAAGLLHTKAGQGRFELETAEVGGVSVPKSVLQELVAYYSKSPQNPKGVSLDAPFELPAGILEVRVGQQNAVIVQ